MSKLDKLKSKLRDSTIKIGEFLTEPSVRKTSKFATGVLEVMSYMNTKNPVSIGTGALSLVDTALDAFEMPYPTKTEHFAKKHDLQVKTGVLPRIIMDAGINKEFSDRIAFTDGSWAVKELTIDENSKMYYAENLDSAVYYQDPLSRLAASFYHTKNFNFEKLFQAIWSKYKNGVFVSARSSPTSRWEEQEMRLHSLSTDDCLFIGEIDPKDFADKIKQFRKDSISRSFMLAGPPGTGKTSMVIEVARHISNRIVRIDPTLAQALSSSEFDFLIENLNPDILVFDDFDRAAMSQDSQQLLFLLENIKNRFPQMVIFATVNHFDKLDPALVRPGRFDEIIWFDLPNARIRAKIADHYLKTNKISVTPELLHSIVEKTEGLSPVYIKELCIRLRHNGVEALESIIEEFSRALSEVDGSFEPPEAKAKSQEEADQEFYISLQQAVERGDSPF